LGIRPGVQIQVSRRNYDGTLSLRLGRKSLSLGESAAKKLWVSAAEATTA
jgi:Fe2+ transport system protein FeoA